MGTNAKQNVPVIVLGTLWVITLILGFVFWPKTPPPPKKQKPPTPKKVVKKTVEKPKGPAIPYNADAGMMTDAEVIAWKKVLAEIKMKWEEQPKDPELFFPRYVYPIIDDELRKATEAGIEPPQVSRSDLVSRLTEEDEARFFKTAAILAPESGKSDAEKVYASETLRMYIRRPIMGQYAERTWGELYREDKKE